MIGRLYLTYVTLLCFVLLISSFCLAKPLITTTLPPPVQQPDVNALWFQYMQVPANASDSQIIFQSHIQCSAGTPCDQIWNITFSAFDLPTTNVQIDDVTLYVYDLTTYNIINTTLIPSPNATVSIDFGSVDISNASMTIYGIVNYSLKFSDMQQILPLYQYASYMLVRVADMMQYKLTVIPGVAERTFSDITSTTFNPRDVIYNHWRQDNQTLQYNSNHESHYHYYHNNNLKSSIELQNDDNNELATNNNKMQDDNFYLSTRPTRYEFIAPRFTFHFPFSGYIPEYQQFNQIHIQLFGFSKFVDRIGVETILPSSERRYDINTPSNTTCYLNSYPIHTYIDTSSQYQVLILDVSFEVYNAIFIPMTQIYSKQQQIDISLDFNCGNNFYMYYHMQNNNNDSISNWIPEEKLAVIFMMANNNNNNNNNLLSLKDNNKTTIYNMNHISLTSTWLPVADVYNIDKSIYNEIASTYDFSLEPATIATEIVYSYYLEQQKEENKEEEEQTYQDNWIKCTFAMDYPDILLQSIINPNDNWLFSTTITIPIDDDTMTNNNQDDNNNIIIGNLMHMFIEPTHSIYTEDLHTETIYITQSTKVEYTSINPSSSSMGVYTIKQNKTSPIQSTLFNRQQGPQVVNVYIALNNTIINGNNTLLQGITCRLDLSLQDHIEKDNIKYFDTIQQQLQLITKGSLSSSSSMATATTTTTKMLNYQQNDNNNIQNAIVIQPSSFIDRFNNIKFNNKEVYLKFDMILPYTEYNFENLIQLQNINIHTLGGLHHFTSSNNNNNKICNAGLKLKYYNNDDDMEHQKPLYNKTDYYLFNITIKDSPKDNNFILSTIILNVDIINNNNNNDISSLLNNNNNITIDEMIFMIECKDILITKKNRINNQNYYLSNNNNNNDNNDNTNNNNNFKLTKSGLFFKSIHDNIILDIQYYDQTSSTIRIEQYNNIKHPYPYYINLTTKVILLIIAVLLVPITIIIGLAYYCASCKSDKKSGPPSPQQQHINNNSLNINHEQSYYYDDNTPLYTPPVNPQMPIRGGSSSVQNPSVNSSN